MSGHSSTLLVDAKRALLSCRPVIPHRNGGVDLLACSHTARGESKRDAPTSTLSNKMVVFLPGPLLCRGDQHHSSKQSAGTQ